MSGTVHGGQQPISGATIKLYVAGSTGYGSAGTELLGSNVVTTSDGSGVVNSNANAGNANNTLAKGRFIIDNDYTCPTINSLVYIVATGGDPGVGGINNTAITLVTALGKCGNLNTNTTIAMNELTTVAAAYALGQFFTPTFGASSTDSIGAPASNLTGITNAFATAVNLVNTSNGIATGTSAASGTNYYLATNDAAKLTTIGNILADCVNSTSASSTACTSLFGAVTPASVTAASDIFQAAVYMSLNPTSTNASSSATNMTTLMGLQTAYQQFGSGLSSAPTDWTLAIQYSGTGIAYNSAAAVDANGDIWLSNANNTGGVVLINGGTGTVGGTAGVTGGVIGFYTTLGTVTGNQPRSVAIDQNGKAWFGGFAANVADSKYYMFRVAGGTGVEATFPLPSGTTQPYAVAVDPANVVFATTTSTNFITTSATATTGTTMTVKTGLEGTSSTTIAIDPNKVAYIPSGGGNSVYEFTTNNYTAVSGSPFASSTLTTPYGAAVDGLGKVWMANSGASSIAYLSSGTFTGITNSCLQSPKFIAIDGSNNVWVTNGNGIGTGNTNFTICEFNSSGTLISNSTGYGLHGIATGRGIAVDLSGNVWVTSYLTTTTNVTEIIGAATPVVNPISVAIKNSTVGTRP
ncbi:MAG: hypothetical protein P4L10_11860 [Acidobacteriaceae bacterium]|nr:hypothetical protein [Acidobacteriaceae bacterium]